MQLKSKDRSPVALISGAGSARGIGFATAQLLGRDGYKLLLTGASSRVHDRAHELREEGFDADSQVADLTSTSEVSALVSKSLEFDESLDVLVVNHGMTSQQHPMDLTGETGSVFDLTREQFDFAMRRNLTSVFDLVRGFLPQLRQSPRGRIVLIGSVSGGLMATRGDAGYAAAKAGLIGLTRSLALDEAEYGITANLIAPGWIATESQTPAEKLQGNATPLKRSGTPGEVASAVRYLASPEAGYLTGQVIVVDGGNSISEERSVDTAKP